MIVELLCVVTDATVPAGTIPQKVPLRQDIDLPRGEDLQANLTFVGQNGTAIDLTPVGTTIKLGLRQHLDDATAKLTKTASITASPPHGKAQILIASADTLTTPALEDNVKYSYDIQLTLSGKRWQVVPVSVFRVLPIVNRPGD